MTQSLPPLNNKMLRDGALIRAKHLLTQDAGLALSTPSLEAMRDIGQRSERCLDYLQHACELYADRPALASRRYELRPLATGGQAADYLPSFSTITYRDLWTKVAALATGWQELGAVRPGEAVGIIGFASSEYVICDLACLYLGAISAPLQAHMASGDLSHIINEAQLVTLACSAEHMDQLEHVLPQCPGVRSVVIIDHLAGDSALEATLQRHRALFATMAHAPALWTLAEVQAAGQDQDLRAPAPKGSDDAVVSYMYTSGSTGLPKGAIFSERIWRDYWSWSSRHADEVVLPQVWLDFAPLNHIAGRNSVLRCLTAGGLLHFTLKPDLSTLFEDLRLARPTIFFLVPRVSAMIYQEFQTEVLRQTKPGDDPEQVKTRVKQQMGRTLLGDRLLSVTTGSAPTAPEIVTFLKECFQAPIYNAYGSTEGGFLTMDDRIQRPYVIDYKLVDAPELNYLTSDKPYPRGELFVKVSAAVAGYLKNPEASRELLTDDGFVRTGDIMEERGPDYLTWVDRRKNILKLSQGEYVSLWRLESYYAGGSGVIDQIYLYGSGVRSYLLAVIVPNLGAVRAVLGLSGEPTEAALRRVLQDELASVAQREELFSYELPRDFILETERFTKLNGLVTESGKQIAAKLKAKYGQRLEAVYASHDQRQWEILKRLQAEATSLPVAEQVRRVAATVLHIDLDQDQSAVAITSPFIDLGGDSLAAVSFTQLLQQVTGVEVPVGLILSPSGSLQQVAEFIAGRLDPASPKPAEKSRGSFADVHGAAPVTISAASLTLEHFLSPDELAAAARLAASGVKDTASIESIESMPKAVLLTGASGFLGRFLLLDLLEGQRPADKVYCVVRAANDQAAAARLVASYQASGAKVQDRVRTYLASGRIVALAGDLMGARLGLSTATWDLLSADVQLIVHNGALVNHAFSYQQLYEPNVLGTAEVIRLALRQRQKKITFVSSVGVAAAGSQQDLPRILTEDRLASTLWQDIALTTHYAAGYSVSKWAGELLLEDLERRFGNPVDIFRCSMILAHRELLGEVNEADFFSRLLVGLMATGVAPASFYAVDDQSTTLQQDDTSGAHFDGLPVDFVAATIAGSAMAPSHRLSVYHCVNDHWQDGVGLDTVAQWVASSGVKLDSMDSYSAWYQEFRRRLEALPAALRQASAWPIVYQWEHPTPYGAEHQLDATQLKARLKALGLESSIPQLSEAFIHRCLAGLTAVVT